MWLRVALRRSLSGFSFQLSAFQLLPECGFGWRRYPSNRHLQTDTKWTHPPPRQARAAARLPPAAQLATPSLHPSRPGLEGDKLSPQGAGANLVVLRDRRPLAAGGPFNQPEVEQRADHVPVQNPFLLVVRRLHGGVQLLKHRAEENVPGQAAHRRPIARHGVEPPQDHGEAMLDADRES